MWSFETDNFRVSWEIFEPYDLDLSWDETGEIREGIDSGLYQAFDSQVTVYLHGAEIGADHLGESIYENPEDFRDHFGMNKIGHGSYFSDMVKTSIGYAREYLKTIPDMRG
jgi:hypothetical protein